MEAGGGGSGERGKGGRQMVKGDNFGFGLVCGWFGCKGRRLLHGVGRAMGIVAAGTTADRA